MTNASRKFNHPKEDVGTALSGEKEAGAGQRDCETCLRIKFEKVRCPACGLLIRPGYIYPEVRK